MKEREFARHIYGSEQKVATSNKTPIIFNVVHGLATFVAKEENGQIVVGWSKVSRGDRFVKKEGFKIARTRFKPIKESLESNFPYGGRYGVSLKSEFEKFCKQAEIWFKG